MYLLPELESLQSRESALGCHSFGTPDTGTDVLDTSLAGPVCLELRVMLEDFSHTNEKGEMSTPVPGSLQYTHCVELPPQFGPVRPKSHRCQSW